MKNAIENLNLRIENYLDEAKHLLIVQKIDSSTINKLSEIAECIKELEDNRDTLIKLLREFNNSKHKINNLREVMEEAEDNFSDGGSFEKLMLDNGVTVDDLEVF